ncbi:MAG: DNA mismatch repair protein MutS [Verrucomicrobiales bacterium]
MSGGDTLTPMMKQYQGMKKSLPGGVLLFFRLGDFYELFFEDAKTAAGVLGLTLTKRNSVPMCGVPYHAAENYIAKLVQAGHRVAIGEQSGEVKPGKLVERRISQVVSAGTIDDFRLLENDRPNYLAAIAKSGRILGLAYADMTTGEFRAAEFTDEQALLDELARIEPAETLVPDDGAGLPEPPHSQPGDGYTFLPEHARELLAEHFGVHSLDGFGCGGMTAAIGAAGAILHYLRHSMHRNVDHVRVLLPYQPESHVLIDAASQANLELVESRSGKKHTLLAALDRTSTPMGARLLRHWLLHPLRDREALVARQDVIAAFLAEPWMLEKTRETLAGIRDVERVLGRLSQGTGNAREMQALAQSLEQLPDLRSHLEALPGAADSQLLHEILGDLPDFSALARRVLDALDENPSAALREGGIFRDGFLPELDELRRASTEGRQWIADLQEREINATGIKSLKVRYNAVFGYFIEITKSNLHLAPERYTRKQTTVGGERFITPELKEIENKILGADERSKALEYEAYLSLRDEVLVHLEALQKAAAALARVDALAGLAETARLFGYIRPVLTDDLRLTIRDGRHPVLDQTLVQEKFVPNDTHLDGSENRLLLITGPNMAGKSTYIRQVALLVIMAQIGAFLPAAAAEIGLVDRVFTRVGASDDLARGQSTFMVEMNETALILNNATDRSLVILDEIGRGTSTFDGLSIAWAVAEYLHDELKSRALFATHYHELTALARGHSGVKNYNVAVREWNDRVIFLRRIVEGSADRSYGIQVARLAGLPKAIITRAKTILNHLESNSVTPRGEEETPAEPKKKRAPQKAPEPPPDVSLPASRQPQLDLFD